MSHGLDVEGSVADGYELVRDGLARFAAMDPEYSAQLAAYVDGRLVVDLTAGASLPSDSMTGAFSATKGVAGIVIGLLVQRGLLDLDEVVCHYWPEFAAQGKAEITVRQLLSHQAGLVGLEGGIDTDGLVDSRNVVARLAAMRPAWHPGSMFGYHGLTIGILAEELTWRVSGETLSEIYERDVRAERAIDFYLGLPESMEHRFRPVRPTPRATTAAAGTRPLDSLADLMGNLSSSNQTLLTSPASPNLRAIRAAGPAAIGGVGTATGLANVYAAAIGSVDGRAPLLSPETIAAISQEQVWGEDRLLGVEMSFAILFMKANRRFDFGSHLAFGHDGAGGAIGFADPRYGLGFGYIPNPMQPPGGADFKGTQLARVLRECAAHVRSK